MIQIGDQDCSLGHCYPQAETAVKVADLPMLLSKGDSAAWEKVVRRYGGAVVAAVRSFRLQDADVRDAVQMTWLRLAENAHRVRDPERLARWLVTTARREALHVLRQHARHALVPPEVGAENVADPGVGPEQRILDRETRQTLENLVAELPPLRRSLLRALFVDNPRSYAEVACAVGIPAGGVGPTRARALRQLRCRLDELGLGPENM